MLLSEMFGVARDVDFEVIGYFGRFILRERSDGTERLLWRLEDSNAYVNADLSILYDIILKAPANIIRLPPPLTDEQLEQLKALYTLGYRWFARDRDNNVYAYGSIKPIKECDGWGTSNGEFARIHEWMPEGVVASLVSWSDPEPYDIAKALGVEG